MVVMTLVLIFVATLFVAYANGANDNFKGVATLFGSGVATYRQALALGTLCTFAGSVTSVFLAAELVRMFSGKGLVPAAVAASPHFLLAVAIGAGCTVILATLLAFPISTTHGLTGALVGAGAMAAGRDLNLSVLGGAFFLPLLLSPLVAVGLTIAAYQLLRGASERRRARENSCVCIGQEPVAAPLAVFATPFAAGFGASVLQPTSRLTVTVGSAAECAKRYPGRVWGVSVQRLLNSAHVASAGVLSFARGLNDTPKIVALMLVVQALDIRLGMLAVAIAMAAGGLLNARKVAHTMSRKIASMSDGQAFTANLVTGLLVIAASRFGLPVSTTHVSVGAISGLGIVNGSVNRGVLRSIVLSWVLTLPIAAAIAAVAWHIAQQP
jgi:inorganic phosphate transporter, PiT family